MVNYCGCEPPRILYTDDNWTHMPTSEDQKRIEAVLPRFIAPKAVWLHVGIGNSSLAKLYAEKIEWLDGITVCPEEIQTAPIFDNYFPRLCDKHNPEFYTGAHYDVIIDTTPTAHACCRKHLLDYLYNLFAMLAPQGTFLTDKVGLAWARPTGKGMNPAEFGDLIAQYGAEWRWLTDSVIAIMFTKEI